MFAQLSKNSFVRSYDDYGYIINQLTQSDRFYNKSGKVFLEQLSRAPKSIEEITVALSNQFVGVTKEQLEIDLVDFLHDLERDCYVVIGEDKDKIALKDSSFSYNFNPVTRSSSRPPSEIAKNNYKLKSIGLELTRKCNERCLHCYIPNEDKRLGQDMALEKAKDYIFQASKMNAVSLTITGGEPFLNKHISEILYYAREQDMMISIFSNLTSVTEDHLKILKEINVSEIQVSLYSLNSATHDLITKVSGSFNKTFRTIKRCREEDIPISISCPALKYNYKDYPELYDWASENRIKIITTLSLTAQYDGDKNNLCHSPTREMKRELLDEILKRDKKWRDRILNSRGIQSTTDPNDQICGAGVSSLYITPVGKVLPCSGWEKYELGDLNTQSLKEIWEQGHQVNKLRKLTIGDYPEYMNSEYKEFIHLCPARFYNHGDGDYLKISDDTIENAKISKELVDNYISTIMSDGSSSKPALTP